ncbi:interleukin-5 receptor subunit alpha [Eleutherodactylus coqui]|uniref:interleukin-5 receptor subunit alpha n=1 Tax=Eleutherodactylus coqui TaxID=57060 RepID=UPI0034618836
MSGAAILLLLLSYFQVFAHDEIQPPENLHIAVPILGDVLLTWKHQIAPQNKSIKYNISYNTSEKSENFETHKNYTQFMVELHGGFTAHVASYIDDPEDSDFPKASELNRSSVSLLPYSGAEGTAASNVSCQIEFWALEKSLLSCNWVPGNAAPADTEYNLYYRFEGVVERCQNYTIEPGGRRETGCHILSSAISITSAQNILVHINGTSKSQKIKAMEKIFDKTAIEIVPPVQNLTLGVNGLHWIKPIQILSDICFQYEVNIQSKSRNYTVTIVNTSYINEDLHKVSSTQLVRVRAVGQKPCWPDKRSQWTEIIQIGEGIDSSDYLGIIVSVCVIVTCIIVFLLCVRFWGHIFPQIPKPKNDLKEAFQNVQSQALMHCSSWSNEEIISYIEEVVEPDKYKTCSDYGHLGDYSSSGSHKPL